VLHGDSGVSYNRAGVPAQFERLRSMYGMNCPSARYVMNRRLRRAYERRWSASIPTHFYDGYVSWECYKIRRLRWQCDEYESYTSFRFTAYTFSSPSTLGGSTTEGGEGSLGRFCKWFETTASAAPAAAPPIPAAAIGTITSVTIPRCS